MQPGVVWVIKHSTIRLRQSILVPGGVDVETVDLDITVKE